MVVGCYLVYLSSLKPKPRRILTSGGVINLKQKPKNHTFDAHDNNLRQSLIRSYEEEEEKKGSYDTMRSNFDL